MAPSGGLGGPSVSPFPYIPGSSGVASPLPASLAVDSLVAALPVDVALPLVQAAMYDEQSDDYQVYRAAWIAEKEHAAREQQRTQAVERAIQQGLVPRQQGMALLHQRRPSRSMFGSAAESASTPGDSRALSPAFYMHSPLQPSSPRHGMTSGLGGFASASCASPLLRSLSPLGSPHSPTVFATMLEANSRNASRAISPLPFPMGPAGMMMMGPVPLLAQQHYHRAVSPQMQMQQHHHHSKHQPHHSIALSPALAPGGGAGLHPTSPSLLGLPPRGGVAGPGDPGGGPGSGGEGADAHGGSAVQQQLHQQQQHQQQHQQQQLHNAAALYNSYDQLRLGWIPSDASLGGIVPVPYK